MSGTDALLWVGVDGDRCSGHARCNAIAPEVFSLDDDGYSDIGESRRVPAGFEQAARLGVPSCPEQALRFVDGQDAG
jgi:ferredoxin